MKVFDIVVRSRIDVPVKYGKGFLEDWCVGSVGEEKEKRKRRMRRMRRRENICMCQCSCINPSQFTP